MQGMALDRDAIYARAARIAAARPHPGDIVDRDRERALRTALLDRDLPDHLMIGAGPQPAVQRAMSDRERRRVRLIRLSARDAHARNRAQRRSSRRRSSADLPKWYARHGGPPLTRRSAPPHHARLRLELVRSVMTSAPPAILGRAGATAAA